MTKKYKRAIGAGLMLAICIGLAMAHTYQGIKTGMWAGARLQSPTAAIDAPIPIQWGSFGFDPPLSVACFRVTNTSTLDGATTYPTSITAVGFDFPGNPRDFSLVYQDPGNAFRLRQSVKLS